MSSFSLVDSHAHVQFPVYDQDRETVIARAREAGVGMVVVGTQYCTSKDAIKVTEPHDGIWATVGFHPNHVDLNSHHDPWELRVKQQEYFDISKFRNIASHPKVVAIGECGLDYYRIANGQPSIKPRVIEKQKEIFIAQIELAQKVKKPLIIHCRQAFDDLIKTLLATPLTLSSYGNGVVHFFSGSAADAKTLIDLGFFLSFGGVVTFTHDYDELVRHVPLDRLLIETDCPYVAPVPYRGKRNEPAYIIETAKKIAALKGVGADEAATKTTENAKKLFRL